MAVVIPLIAAAASSAAGLAIAGLTVAQTAAAMATVAGLVSTTTGAGRSIDRAASKVFGKDVVTAFNIAGTVYGAFGGFSGQAPGAVWDNATSAFSGAAGGADAATSQAWADGAGKGLDTVSAVGGGEVAATQGATSALEAAASTPDMLTAGYDDIMGNVMAQQQPDVLTQQAGPAAGDPTRAALYSDRGYGAGSGTPAAADPKTADKGTLRGMWDSMGDRTRGALIQTGGQMLSGYAQGRAREQELADERARRGNRLGVRYGRPSISALEAATRGI